MTDHERKRAKIEADMAAFRKAGGRVRIIPAGLSGDPWDHQASRGPKAQQRLTARYTAMLIARKEAAARKPGPPPPT